MREIKFRAKRLANGEWAFGSGLLLADDFCVIDTDTEMYTEEEYEWAGNTHFFRVAGAMCDKGTIGQYTGCIDKNGKEIYEGDIIKVYVIETRGDLFSPSFEHYIKEVVAEVKWEDASFIAESEEFAFGPMSLPFITEEYERDVATEFSTCCNLDKYPELTQEDINNCECIGNIYDNKEYLEE